MTQTEIPDLNEENASRTGRSPLRPLRQLLPYLKPYGKVIIGAQVALILAAGTVLAIGSGLRRLVDTGFRGANPEILDQALMLLLGVIFVLACATYGRFYLVSWLGERVIADLRREVFNRVIRLSPAFFEINRTGEILSRVTTDTTLIQVVVGSHASIALRNFLLFFGGTVMMTITSPKLTGLVALVVPLVIGPIMFFGRRVRRLSRASQDRVADVGAYVEETLNAVRTVQAFGHEGIDRKRFGEQVENAFQTAIQRVRARAILTVTVIVLIFTSIVVVLWMGGRDVLAGDITPGELSAFVFYAIVVAGATGALSEVIGDLQRAAGATERLLHLLSIEPQITAPPDPKPLPSPGRGEVAFEDVTFRYPVQKESAALDGFSLAVAPGENIALVGPSGAGKTTVFQLLLRFYDPQSGSIRLDGIDLRDADPAELRNRMGVVPQDPVIFSADAWENIRYGRPDASDDEVRAAAEAAVAVEFLDRMPDGFDTFLGERGVRLSGGQRQRIAIARAILRSPTVLLLDEATSALDSANERLVQRALERLSAGRTTIVIAHRLATVLKADRIIVMDDGRIVASGTHEELIKQGGLYARLAEMQFDLGEGSDESIGTLGPSEPVY